MQYFLVYIFDPFLIDYLLHQGAWQTIIPKKTHLNQYNIIFTGTSAGSSAVTQHLDWLAQQFDPKQTRVIGVW